MKPMLNKLSNWFYWWTHPLPKELHEFRQNVVLGNSEYTISPATIVDASALFRVEQAAYVGGAPWPVEVFRNEISHARYRLYVMVCMPGTNTVIGYVGIAFRPGVKEAHVTNLAVDPIWQSRGIGRFLMIYAMTIAQQVNFQRMSLEVRKSNVRAQALYEELGFQKIRTKRAYYEDGEDGYDMAQILVGGFSSGIELS